MYISGYDQDEIQQRKWLVYTPLHICKLYISRFLRNFQMPTQKLFSTYLQPIYEQSGQEVTANLGTLGAYLNADFNGTAAFGILD